MVSLPIWYPEFDYTFLWQDGRSVMAYLALLFCMISFYLIRNNYIRAGLFFITLMLALFAQRIAWISLPFILIYLCVYYYALNAGRPWLENLAFITLIVLSITMIFIPVPGIQNWSVVQKWQLTQNAIPYSMRFTFDKSLIGLFFIWFSAYSLANQSGWKQTLKMGSMMGAIAILILIPLSFLLGYVQIDIKLTPFIYLWLINNLFFVCFAEEALFRGLIQNYLSQKLTFKQGSWVALVISSILFGLVHFQGGIKYILLATVAGLCYGYAFKKTKRIEASVITHWMVNTAHFIFFTYPALKAAF